MKRPGFSAIPSVAALILASAPMLFAADVETPKPGASELESKVKMLEERIQKLEQQLDQANKSRGGGDVSNRTWPPRENNWREFQRRRFGRDFDDMLDQLQREFAFGMEQNGGPGFQPQTPFNTGNLTGQRPRLGVEMASATDEYRERFKNDVKDGAFVLEVVPGSPAEKAGIAKGDCITSFAGKSVSSPQELKEAVIDAPKGKNDILVTRRGESLKLKVDLAEVPAEDPAADLNLREQNGWLQRGNGGAIPGGTGTQKTRTDVHSSALEMSDELAKELDLNPEQKKKMSDVLARHSQLLGEDIAKSENGAGIRNRGNGNALSFNLNLNTNINQSVEKHAAEAEKELTANGTLTAEQIKKWADYRHSHNSLSFSHSVIIENNGGGAPAPAPEREKKDKGQGTGF